MRVRCTSARLNLVLGGRRVQPGEIFSVAAVPSKWQGLVEVLEDAPKAAIINPEQGNDLERLKAAYKEQTGKPAHYTWDAERIRTKLAEAAEQPVAPWQS